MAAMSSCAAEMWEMAELSADPTREQMEGAGCALTDGPVRSDISIIARSSGAADSRSQMDGSGLPEAVCLPSRVRPFCVYPLPVQLSTAGGRWTPASILVEMPYATH